MWMNKRFLCLLPIFSALRVFFHKHIPEGTSWNMTSRGHRVKPGVFAGSFPESELVTTPKKSLLRGEAWMRMALHSEAEAEESHQEQGERAEGLGDHDTST